MFSKRAAFTLIEMLIVLGVIGLLLTIFVFSLYSKQAENRDLKRVSDIQTLRQAMSVVKTNTGTFERALCSLGNVSACAAQKDSELLGLLPQLANLNDPKSPSASCSKIENCQSGICNYGFSKIEADDYEILFYLEKGVNDFSESGCYIATPQGIRKN